MFSLGGELLISIGHLGIFRGKKHVVTSWYVVVDSSSQLEGSIILYRVKNGGSRCNKLPVC